MTYFDPDFFRCKICKSKFFLIMPLDSICDNCRRERST